MTLFMGSDPVAHVDVDASGMPGVTFLVPPESTVGGTERERIAVRDGAAALVAGIKDERDESAEKRLAGHIKTMKREAFSRDVRQFGPRRQARA